MSEQVSAERLAELASKTLPVVWVEMRTMRHLKGPSANPGIVGPSLKNRTWFRPHEPVAVQDAIAELANSVPDLLSALSQSQARVAELEAAIEKHLTAFRSDPYMNSTLYDRELWSVLSPQAEET